MNAKELSKKLNVPYATTLQLLFGGVITAEKVKGKWVISDTTYLTFKQANDEKIRKLKEEYISLYWQGFNPERLQKRVEEDFKKRSIVAKIRGFAQVTIYESLPKRSGAQLEQGKKEKQHDA